MLPVVAGGSFKGGGAPPKAEHHQRHDGDSHESAQLPPHAGPPLSTERPVTSACAARPRCATIKTRLMCASAPYASRTPREGPDDSPTTTPAREGDVVGAGLGPPPSAPRPPGVP